MIYKLSRIVFAVKQFNFIVQVNKKKERKSIKFLDLILINYRIIRNGTKF